MTRIQAVGYQAGKRGFLLFLACRSEQKVIQTSLEWVLQIKRPGRETDYQPYPSTKMKDQPAVTALTVLIAVV